MTETGRRTATKRPMSPERREEILQSLEDIVLSEGFAALSSDEIARRLQCSKATLYAVASSREQLIIQTFERAFRRRVAAVAERVARATGARDRIAVYISALRDEMSSMSRKCYEDMRAFEGTDAAYRRVTHASATRLEQYIAEGINDGVFRPGSAKFAGLAVHLLLDAVLDGTFSDEVGLSDADAYVEITALLLDGLSIT